MKQLFKVLAIATFCGAAPLSLSFGDTGTNAVTGVVDPNLGHTGITSGVGHTGANASLEASGATSNVGHTGETTTSPGNAAPIPPGTPTNPITPTLNTPANNNVPNPGGNQPGSGNTSVNQPGSGNTSVNQPGNGNTSVNQPGNGNTAVNQPGNGNTAVNQPGNGNTSVNQPGSGNQPPGTSRATLQNGAPANH